MTVELYCKELVFSFNKKHLEDASVPMWVIKAKGSSYYVNHVTCDAPWSTKETPTNAHTKGAIKVKQVLLKINSELDAHISVMSDHDRDKLETLTQPDPGCRITWLNHDHVEISNYIRAQKIKHEPFRLIHGSCGSQWKVTHLKHEADVTSLDLALYGKFRKLLPTEYLSLSYDKVMGKTS